MSQVIGYVGDADCWCRQCAEERYMEAECSGCGEAGNLGEGWHQDCPSEPGYFTAYDGEGNEVAAISAYDSAGDRDTVCGGCGEVIMKGNEPKHTLNYWTDGGHLIHERELGYLDEFPDDLRALWENRKYADPVLWHEGCEVEFQEVRP